MRDDGLESYFRGGLGIRKQLWNEELQNNPDAYVSSPFEGNHLLMQDSKRVLLLTPDAATDLTDYPCHLSRAPRDFAKQSVGYIFQKNSVYSDVFSFSINKLIEFGNIDYIMNTLADNQHFMACPKEKVDKPFGYENIFSIFILFAVVVAFSFVLVLGEFLISSWKRLKIVVILKE